MTGALTHKLIDLFGLFLPKPHKWLFAIFFSPFFAFFLKCTKENKAGF